MGSFRPKTFGITVLSISVVIFVLFISVSGDGGIGAVIPPPTLELVEQNGNLIVLEPDGDQVLIIQGLEVPNVACWMKQTVTIFTLKDPTPVATLQSPFFRSQPIFGTPIGSFIDTETGRSLSEGLYVTRPEIKCVSGEIETSSGLIAPIGEIDPEDPTLFDSFPNVSTPLTIQDSFFKISIFAELPNGTWKEVFNAPYTIERFDISSPQGVGLDTFSIRQEWIDRYLPEGDYNSKYRFVYDGAVLMNWKQTNLCDVNCAKIPFVIPVTTIKTFNTDGQLVEVFNEFQVSRDVTVGKPQGSGEVDITCDPITQTIDPDTGVCIGIPPSQQICEPNQVRSGGVCVTIGSPDNPNDISIPFQDLFNKIQICLASGEPSCLASAELLPLWIFGIGVVVIVGAVAQRRQPDIYGVPT